MSESNTIVAKIETCEVCLSKLEGPELDFGYQPLCDELKASAEESLLVTKYHQNILTTLYAAQIHLNSSWQLSWMIRVIHRQKLNAGIG